ncbi:PIR Superfamily Protein [Plasmodium ovale curtisi]|uniref:PIR Superfamily Protein n=1 Tax=Plasmodium ovale curtisi TaxID=864141 RepID=A0A1A8WMD8_PLAOA|nr:PIR Superfamily Protein [Plasmodium ovale curtisi]SBS99240.1 PIR Superfamily Protein [Plasmodium ovale curtisi]
MSSSVQDIYSFFEFFKKYKSYESAMEKKYLEGTHDTSCDSYLSDFQNLGTERANDICVKFKILYNLIISTKTSPNSKSLDDIDFAYLNYWLNAMSRSTTISNKLTVEEFQKSVGNIELEFANVMFDGKFYDIEEDDFETMELLDYLHLNNGEIYSKIIKITKEDKIICFPYVQELIQKYKKGIIKCPLDITNFCKALKYFKGEYENIYFGEFGISKNCIDGDRIQLPTYYDVSLEVRKNTIFTPFGQWVRAKIGKNKETQNNLYGENDSSLLNTSDKLNIDFDEDPYRISYESMQNI